MPHLVRFVAGRPPARASALHVSWPLGELLGDVVGTCRWCQVVTPTGTPTASSLAPRGTLSTGRPEFACEGVTVDLRSSLSQKERDELETLMDVRDPSLAGPMQGAITRVHGLRSSYAGNKRL
jgi:hypothetical protein